MWRSETHGATFVVQRDAEFPASGRGSSGGKRAGAVGGAVRQDSGRLKTGSHRNLVEESNHVHTTAVVYTIAIENGCSCVRGVDESDGVELIVSASTWDGEILCFATLFPPTQHKASHELKVDGKGVRDTLRATPTRTETMLSRKCGGRYLEAGRRLKSTLQAKARATWDEPLYSVAIVALSAASVIRILKSTWGSFEEGRQLIRCGLHRRP